MKTPKQTIAKSVTSWVENAEKNGHQPATQIKLCHVTGNGELQQRHKVQDFLVVWPGGNLSDLVQQILETATEHANNGKIVGTGAEEYHIIPFFGTDKEEGGHSRFTIFAARTATGDAAGSFSEGPSDTGIKHMGMRHLEKRFEQVDAKDAFITNALQEELKRAYARIAGLEKSLEAANVHLEEAKDKSLERKLAIYKANSEEQRKDKAMDAIIPVAGQLANAFIGAPIFNVNTDDQAMQHMISFLSSFDTKQLAHMYQCMNPQQKIIFDATMEEIKKAKLAAMQEKQKQADAAVNGVERDPKTVETMAKRKPQHPDGSPNP